MFEETVKSDLSLFSLVYDGNEFHPEFEMEPGSVLKTEINVEVSTTVKRISCSDSLKLKSLFREFYGPCTVKAFTEKMQDIFDGLMNNSWKPIKATRTFIRKIWLLKQIYELFEGSLELITKTSNLLIKSYSAMFVFKVEIIKRVSKRMKKYVDIAFETIHRVHKKINNVIASDSNLLKLLPPNLLEYFVKHASPHMVSKIKCLPWIEPEIALMATPGYNIYWTEFWLSFFERNFKLSSEVCRIIAEFMPMALQGETFLDFFRRNYYGGNKFRVKYMTYPSKCWINPNEYWGDITVTL